jgi:hypothetical protein
MKEKLVKNLNLKTEDNIVCLVFEGTTNNKLYSFSFKNEPELLDSLLTKKTRMEYKLKGLYDNFVNSTLVVEASIVNGNKLDYRNVIVFPNYKNMPGWDPEDDPIYDSIDLDEYKDEFNTEHIVDVVFNTINEDILLGEK